MTHKTEEQIIDRELEDKDVDVNSESLNEEIATDEPLDEDIVTEELLDEEISNDHKTEEQIIDRELEDKDVDNDSDSEPSLDDNDDNTVSESMFGVNIRC